MKKFNAWLLALTFFCIITISALAVTHSDYPHTYPGYFLDDGYGFGQAECTSYVAWRLNVTNGIAFTNTTNPLTGESLPQWLVSDDMPGVWGNAREWVNAANYCGIPVDNAPAPGAVYWSGSGYYGHVAWVSEVRDGHIVVIEQYNYGLDAFGNPDHLFSSEEFEAGSRGESYIHVKDLNAEEPHNSIINYFLNTKRGYDNQLDAVADQFASENKIWHQDYTILTDTPTRSEMDFLGWSTDPDATAPDPQYAPGSIYTKEEPLNLYAVWKVKGSSGEKIVFGRWEQDGHTENGKERLEWRVIYSEGSTKLVVTEKIIDAQRFGAMFGNWNRSSVRTWLNETFFTQAFTGAEQGYILKKDQVNLPNAERWYGTYGSDITSDRVFLLSQSDAAELFDSDESRRALVTTYSKSQGVSTNSNGFGTYWLRTVGAIMGTAQYVKQDGSIEDWGDNPGSKMGVRPAMWLSSESIPENVGEDAAAEETPTPTPTPTPVLPEGVINPDTPLGDDPGLPTAAPTATPTPTPAPSPVPTPTPTPIPPVERMTTRPPQTQPTIASSFATPTPAVTAAINSSAYTNIQKVNVRKTATSDGKKIDRIESAGTSVTILGEQYDQSGTLWYKVKLRNSTQGYVRSDLLTTDRSAVVTNAPTNAPRITATPAPVGSSTSGQYAYTNIKKVIVRSAAKSGSRQVVRLEQNGTAVYALGSVTDNTGKSWTKVRTLNGQEGYIQTRYLDFSDGSTGGAWSLSDIDRGSFSTYSVQFVKNRDFNAYSGPGSNYVRGANGRAYMSSTDSAYVYGSYGDWLLVQYYVNNSKWRFGYVSSSLIASGDVPPLYFSNYTATVIRSSYLTDDPLHSRDKLFDIPQNANVTVLGYLDNWAYVEYGNVRGFISSSSLR